MNKPEIRYTKPFINGEYISDPAGGRIAVFCPADGKQICEVETSTHSQIDAAVNAARAALPVWNALSAELKSAALRRVAEAIRKRNDWIGELETYNSGIPITTTKGHFANRSAVLFEYFSGMPDKLHGRVVPIDPAYVSMTMHEPLGVAGILLPWNAPFPELCLSVSAALACGNAVVVKPASDTPLTALIFGEICSEAGLPPGLVNIVLGSGGDAGTYIASHKGIDKVSFTGGIETGKGVLRAGADNLKSCTLELGGKTAVIVCPDADLDFAAAQVSFSAVRNSGQICTAASRLFVHNDIAEQFIDDIKKRMESYRAGDPFDSETVIGPLVSLRHKKYVESCIEEGIQSGAKLLTGGGSPGGSLANGYYVNPVLFSDADHAGLLAQREIFGPVLTVFTYDTLDNVIQTANDVKYGLASAIFTSSIKNSQEFIRRSEAGVNWVNCINISHPAISHGGFKESGLGIQNGMDAALYSYTRIKTAWINRGV
jgi:acyl-CoA reductase-like NAD-dependent aldehyde dehydrogenase